jgi:hypothetical protein
MPSPIATPANSMDFPNEAVLSCGWIDWLFSSLIHSPRECKVFDSMSTQYPEIMFASDLVPHMVHQVVLWYNFSQRRFPGFFHDSLRL